jgi:hypothetical protein
MIDPSDISDCLYLASPEGRLETLQSILQEMLDAGEDVDAFHFRKKVEIAQYAISSGNMVAALSHIVSAQTSLTLIDMVGEV